MTTLETKLPQPLQLLCDSSFVRMTTVALTKRDWYINDIKYGCVHTEWKFSSNSAAIIPEANHKLYNEFYFYYDYQYKIYSGKLSVLIAIAKLKHHKISIGTNVFFSHAVQV